MKRIISLLMVLVIMPFAFAQETTVESEGVMPDSGLYGLDLAIENIETTKGQIYNIGSYNY